jgi:hypothetical protein
MSTYPDFVARFYDVVYGQVRDAIDKQYYVRQLVSCQGPSLEVGVGTGRVFDPLPSREREFFPLHFVNNPG